MATNSKQAARNAGMQRIRTAYSWHGRAPSFECVSQPAAHSTRRSSTMIEAIRWCRASTLDPELRESWTASDEVSAGGARGQADPAERALAQGLKKVVFDRGGYPYHGRVKALAESSTRGRTGILGSGRGHFIRHRDVRTTQSADARRRIRTAQGAATSKNKTREKSASSSTNGSSISPGRPRF
jgi:large subunit ribosomal protein L18